MSWNSANQSQRGKQPGSKWLSGTY
jgi:hypothetical protein